MKSTLDSLKNIFKKGINIENMLISEVKSNYTDLDMDLDLVLFTSEYLKIRASRYIYDHIPNMVTKRVINHKNIKDLISIEKGTDVLLVNDSYESAKEAIEQLIDLGLDHIRYNAYYPGCSSYPRLEIVVTLGENHLIPYKPDKLIDIGSRIIDITSIHHIATELGLNNHISDSLVTDYIRDIVEISKSIEENRKISQEAQQILQIIVNNLDYGVGFINNQGRITSINSKFEYIFGQKKKDLIGKELDDIVSNGGKELKNGNIIIRHIENKKVLIQVRQVNDSKDIGYILMLDYQNSKSKSEGNLNNIDNTYIKRKLLNFEDYRTINKDAIKVINRAKKFAKSDGTILITGENGSGKEILAQAIHANSYRNKKSFVPINIATLTPNLVESELFGYEEGTFTGAVKGGRMGIFELANGGTIFIDEIGDVPLNVQTKLLRVLEEKKIRRVGASEELSIDVRIIAATNKNLLKLVDENKFKLDLFFRLNILPLEAIPLRKRKEDIEYLLKYFINMSMTNSSIDSLNEFFEVETIDFLNNYRWPGNVRELINLVEYLVLIYEGEKIGISSLHTYMYENINEGIIVIDEEKLWVLEQFEIYEDIPLGRTRITELAIDQEKEIGEGKIRTILNDLKQIKLIRSYGKVGSKITELGKKTVDQYR